MKCRTCQNENPKDAQFCNQCGADLSSLCPVCGTGSQPDDIFCRSCGQSLQSGEHQKSSQKTTPKTESAASMASSKPAKQTASPAPATAPKKKMPAWQWIAISAAGMFFILFGVLIASSPSEPVESPAMEATITPIVLPTATAMPTPSPQPTPVYKNARIELLCEEDQIAYVFEHQPIAFQLSWVASDAEKDRYFDEVSDKVNYTFMLDGSEVTAPMDYYPPEWNQHAGLHIINFGFEMDPLSVGWHTIETIISFSDRLVIEGIEVGPGTEIESLTQQCGFMVGAPNASWEVVAHSDFTEDKGLFPSMDIEYEWGSYSLREAEDGVLRARTLINNFLAADLNSSPLDLIHEDFRVDLPAAPESPDFLVSFDMELKTVSDEADYIGLVGIIYRVSEEDEEGCLLGIAISSEEEIKPGGVEFGCFSSQRPEPLEYGELLPSMNLFGRNEVVFLVSGNIKILWINGINVFFLQDDNVPMGPGKNSLVFVSEQEVESETVIEIDNLIIRSPEGTEVSRISLDGSMALTDVGEYEYTYKPQDVFTATVFFRNTRQGTGIKTLWYAVNALGLQPNMLISEMETTANPISETGDYSETFTLRNDQPWPPGIYKIEVYVDGTFQRELSFLVDLVDQ